MNSLDQIIFSEKLADKLAPVNLALVRDFSPTKKDITLTVDFFRREDCIKITKEKIKFPSLNKMVKDKCARAQAIASFANHELQAIECMAYAIKYFWKGEEKDKSYIRGLLSAIADEQKHFKLYRKIISDLGYDIGEFPKNDFFLRHLIPIQNLSQFAAMMNLTFESANIDFAIYYKKFFETHNFFDIADCLDIVLTDEIGHVSLGKIQLETSGHEFSLWDEYLNNLIYPLTPARARGIEFRPENRKATNLDEDFIVKLSNYSDSYSITNRKK